MTLPRARFDECQGVAGIGTTQNGDHCPVSEHAKRQESVDFRHPQCSLKSVESASHRKIISIIEERGKSEELESSQPMLHSSSSVIELDCAAAQAVVWQSGSCTCTLHCQGRNNQIAIRAPRSAIKTAAATGRASKLADQLNEQTKSSHIKRSKTIKPGISKVCRWGCTGKDLMHHWQPCFRTVSAILIVLSTGVAKDAISSFDVQSDPSTDSLSSISLLGWLKTCPEDLAKHAGAFLLMAAR